MTSSTHRRTATGPDGAVAAGSASAGAIGLAVMREGGNAFDAASAAALSETVLLPSKCGLGGDLVALYRTAADPTVMSMVSVGDAPGALVGMNLDDMNLENAPAPVTGPLSVGIPGAPAGYAALASMGQLSLAELARPAVTLADNGYPWSKTNARLAGEARDLLDRWQPGGTVYSPTGSTLLEGQTITLTGLGHLLREFVDTGAALFHGATGQRLVDHVAELGGALTSADLRAVTVDITRAARIDVQDRSVYATNYPTYGPALLDALAHDDVADIESVRDALTRYRGAPHPLARTGGTSTISAVDAAGNAVVVIHSNSFPQFGSGLVVPGLDLVLSNRPGRGFTFESGHPNSPRHGRRPLTTLHGWAVEDEDIFTIGGTPGGEQQVPWNLQLLRRLLSTGTSITVESIAQSLDEPRWEIASDGTESVEGRDLPTFGARSSHTVTMTGSGCAAVSDPRSEGGAFAR